MRSESGSNHSLFPDLDPPVLQNDPLRLPPFHFDADQDLDPTFHCNADPDPASQKDADTDLQHCFTYVRCPFITYVNANQHWVK
jgi:hypothetical protein